MNIYANHFSITVDFLKTYEHIVDCHLVDFITKNLWEMCLPIDLRLYAEEKGATVINDIAQFDERKQSEESKLNTFLKGVYSLKLENCSNIITRNEFLNIIQYEKTEALKPIQSELMKVKKWHEVDIFTKTVAWLNEDKAKIVIDAGAGKAYSSLYLSCYYDLPVLAIESSQINHKGALLHRDLVNKKDKQLKKSLIHYVVEQIDETTDFSKLAKNYFPDLYPQKELIMTALHACGSLTDTVIKSFLINNDIKCLCVLPCCYHLASNSLSRIYEFSKNLRMLAQQSIDRIRQKNEFLSQSLYYRAVLQVILQQLGIQNVKIGRGAPLDDFLTYAKWALKKVNIEKIPSDEMLELIYEQYKHLEWKFHAFQLLRIQLASLVETAIILDKLLFIQNSKICTKLELVQLFDPKTSPRSWAIIARK